MGYQGYLGTVRGREGEERMKREKIDNYTEPLKESKSHVLCYASTDLTHIRFSFSNYWCVYLHDAAFYDYGTFIQN